MSGWFARQFGDRDQFAIEISLGRDPHPIGVAHVDATWGTVAVWAQGRCLTRSVSGESSVADGVSWNLFDLMEWFVAGSVRLVNEEPLPWSLLPGARDASAWANESAQLPKARTGGDEKCGFEARSSWLAAHGLRRALVDVAMPNVVVRRLGASLEVSWDNEEWKSSRPDVRFVEPRGCAFVDARSASGALLEAVRVVTRALAERHKDVRELLDLAERAARLEAASSDWRWLVHRRTADTIESAMAGLASKLRDHTAATHSGVLVPHVAETLLLREALLETPAEILALLEAARVRQSEPLSNDLLRLVSRSQASPLHPWTAGYEVATHVRELLGWGAAPIEDLRGWLAGQGVQVGDPTLARGIAVVAARSDEQHATVAVNTAGRWPLRRETGLATALGHILMDPSPVAVDGEWEHWPTAARARAFGAMLLMPEEGVADALGSGEAVDAAGVERVMDRFHTGAHATTYHLMNMGFIDDERRGAILAELTG